MDAVLFDVDPPHIHIARNNSTRSYVQQPHIYVKGGDYTIDTINQNERRALEERNIEIQILKFKAGFSTTLMIDKIIKAYGWTRQNFL